MASMEDRDLFLAEVRKLVGTPCWGIVAGAGTGSVVSLDFGKKIAREQPLRNTRVSEAVRHNKGEFHLFVEDCAWRVETDTAVLCGSASDNSNDGEMVTGLRRLEGQIVREVVVSEPALDLTVVFGDGLKLLLFCETLQEDDADNFVFFSPIGTFVVQSFGLVRLERSQPNPLRLVE